LIIFVLKKGWKKMSTVEALLQEINKLPQNEVEELMKRILHSSHHVKSPITTVSAKKNIAGKYAGIGKGLWKEDAQHYVTHGRTDNRE
jgi:hypothetical protein